MPKVLLTGGSGFIAGHCISLLLERGYDVVTTVRSAEKGTKVLNAHTVNGSPNDKLAYYVVEDVAQKGAYDAVVKSNPDLDFVIHTTSPFHYNIRDPAKDFLEPAVTGVTTLLEAIRAYAPIVKRVVFTSSFAAMRDGSSKHPPLYDDTCWNPVTWDDAVKNTKVTYQGSKTLAERAAWSFMSSAQPGFDFVAINPVLVFGPAAPHLSTAADLSTLNTSNVRILDMITGKMTPHLQQTGFYSFADVRDVALGHVNALTAPGAGGKRFLMVSGYHTNKRIAQIIASRGAEFRDRLPDLDAEVDDLPAEGDRYTWDCRGSVDVLGVKYMGLEKSIQDTVDSLVRLGAMETRLNGRDA